MKMKSKPQITIALLLTVFVTFAVGCATMSKNGVKRAEKTTTSMQTVDSDIRQASMQIDNVKTTLDDLIKTGQSPAAQPDDVKVAYTEFSKNADNMEKTGNKLNKHIDEMASRGNDYFEEWGKEGGTYTDPQIQKLSEENRARLNSTFRDLQLATASVRANLNAYMSDLKQIQTYLSNDLTQQGIAAISPIANSLQQDGAKLKQSFDPVETSIMQARAQLVPGGAAAGGAGQQPDQQK